MSCGDTGERADGAPGHTGRTERADGRLVDDEGERADGERRVDDGARTGSETVAGARPGAHVLVIDNYDSFAYNLVQYVGEFASEVEVRRNDAIDLDEIRRLDPDGIVVSPGPGTPQEAGISIPLFAELSYPTLGVCLGHQALCAANGAAVVHAPEVVHGKPSTITHDGTGIFAGLASPLEAGRYHSLAIERTDLPTSLVETARTDDERAVVMAVRHRTRPHVGVQFHPESILTETGKAMIENFCTACTR